MAWTVEPVTPTSTTPPTTAPALNAAPLTSGRPDTEALARGDFRSVGGIDASEEHGGGAPGYEPVQVPPDAGPVTRMLAPVQNYVRAFNARQGQFPPEPGPPSGPNILGVPNWGDIKYGARTFGDIMSMPGNEIAAIGDVLGHPTMGSAGKFAFDTIAPILGGLYGVYQRATAGEPEALAAWNRAVQAVQDWRAAQATRAGEVAAAREAQGVNAARTAEYGQAQANAAQETARRAEEATNTMNAATSENVRRLQAAQDYEAATGTRTTPKLVPKANITPSPVPAPTPPEMVPVPEVNPLQSPAPPMATRMLAQSPQPGGFPTFAQWLAGGAMRGATRGLQTAEMIARRGWPYYLIYRMTQGGNRGPTPGEPG